MSGPLKNSNPEMGELARKRREELGLSRTELAEILGVGRTRMQQMEAEGVMGLDTIERWANALGIDPSDLAFPVRHPAEKQPKKKAKKS
jgi:transcriptional regulator with XRE-family HTH domain